MIYILGHERQNFEIIGKITELCKLVEAHNPNSYPNIEKKKKGDVLKTSIEVISSQSKKRKSLLFSKALTNEYNKKKMLQLRK